MVPAAANHPLARLKFAQAGANPLLKVRNRARAFHVDAQQPLAGVGQVGVGVIKTRQNELAFQVDDFCLWSHPMLHLFGRADGGDLAAGDGDGFDPAQTYIHRVDIPVGQHDVGSRRLGEEPRYQAQQENR